MQEVYKLGAAIKATGDKTLLDDWRKMTTSDHFYYMCIKWFSDGDVHKYFNPYDSPYEGFISFMNVLNDLSIRVRELAKKNPALAVRMKELALVGVGGSSASKCVVSESPLTKLYDSILKNPEGFMDKL
jgi:alpha-amylase/alpha-mannosidase (GH57 family)